MIATATIAGCVAALAALAALYFAAATVAEARAERRDSRRDRLRQQLWRVGDLIEELGEQTQGIAQPGTPWTQAQTRTRNKLTHAMMGLRDLLTDCASIRDKGTPYEVGAVIAVARNEVERELERLAAEDAEPPATGRRRWLPWLGTR